MASAPSATNQAVSKRGLESISAPIFLNYDQAELDALYNQANFAPNAAQIHERTDANSAAIRERLGQPLRLSYGPSAIEKLDLYKCALANAPIFVYIHGGSWRNGSAARAAFPAEMFVKAGAHFAALDFISIDEAGKDLTVLADQVRRATIWVHQNAASFGGDPHRLYVGGHSSGAHLAGTVLTTDWAKDFGLPNTLIKGGLCCSGMHDLYPVSLSARNTFVDFHPDVVKALSPQRHIDKVNCPLIVAYGTYESPEFQRQSREFSEALEAAGKPVRLLIAKGYNHFEVAETLANPYGLLGRAVLEQMALTQG